jgi:aminoglycoside phosphotransferase (APT) family kinase protein
MSSTPQNDLLERARAMARAAGLDPAALAAAPGGHSASLFRVLDHDGHPTAAVKLLARGAARARAEAAALRASAHLPTPDLLHADFTAPAALVLSWLHPRAQPADAWLPDASPGARARFARDLGAALRDLHATAVTTTDVKLSDDPLPLHERLLAQLDRAASRLARRADTAQLTRDLDLVRLAQSTLPADLERALAGAPRRLIHRDLRPANLIVGDDAFVGLVDLERAAAGPPAWDAVKLTWWLTDLHPDLHDPLWAAYGDPPPPARVHPLMLFEAATLLAVFAGKHEVYPGEARRQLEALCGGTVRPRWRAPV